DITRVAEYHDGVFRNVHILTSWLLMAVSYHVHNGILQICKNIGQSRCAQSILVDMSLLKNLK
ncbi:hypothetical protein ALC53_04687, partial [Atta colombica]